MSYQFGSWHVRDEMLEPIDRYIKHGTPVGDFLSAVICNDLSAACGRADEENLANLPAFVAYFHNEAPFMCWGSRDRMKAWIRFHEEKREAMRGPDFLDESEAQCPR